MDGKSGENESKHVGDRWLKSSMTQTGTLALGGRRDSYLTKQEER